MNARIPVILFLCFIALQLSAQEKSKIKFGKITEDDFKQNVYSIDSNANAVVIADIGSTEIVGNDKGNFSLEFKKFERIHILNKNGFDAANVEIGIYTNGEQEEKLNDLKAVTYNLENGKVTETKLDTKENVFKDKISKKLIIKKFTLPNIKEGSIIEFQYKIHSDFIFNLQPWEFQSSYPHLWSEYNVSIPQFYEFITLTQGYQPFFIKSQKDGMGSFNMSETNGTEATKRLNFTSGVTQYKWVMKDVPALIAENYTSTINNHIARIEFQLSGLKEPFTPKKILASWPEAAADLLKDEEFGLPLGKDNSWLNDIMPVAIHGAGNDLDKARNIFAYLRDNMSCSNYGKKYIESSLKTVWKTSNGNEAEINLLLIAMLRKAGLMADPVILSTRSHGNVYAFYPLLDRFNYVIARVQIDNQDYYLDASHRTLGFAKLTNETYNGHARVINESATPIGFQADSIKESKLNYVIIIIDEKGNLSGSMKQSLGYLESYKLRQTIKEKGKTEWFNAIKKGFDADVEILMPSIDSLDNPDMPVNVHYDFNIKLDQQNIIYINPMFSESLKENPLKSATRYYPVEMPHPIDETYLLKLDVPPGYVIDELPKQIRLKLNENNDGFFEYLISESGGVISLQSHVLLKRTYYTPEEYTMLREFFNLIVKKQNEQIVFKKK